jgi:hypothetical protein
LAASSAPAEVTMFQPARPPLTWSTEASRRARLYGSLYVEETVAISPILLGRLGQRGEQRQRFELARRPELARAGDRRAVREEQRVELRALGQPGQPDPMPQVEVRPRIALRKPPRCLVVACLHEEGVQVQPAASLRTHEGTPQ